MIIAINKPTGPTSHDIINMVRRTTGIQTVGHAGTLDPLASGVLVVGIGKDSTKQLQQIVKSEKEYQAEITLGEISTTDDAQGTKTQISPTKIPKQQDINSCLKNFVGTINQVPPAYSAIKIKGVRSYKAARKGHTLNLEARPVFIKEIKIDQYNWPILKITVTTGQGVYIRSLARDIGAALGTGGYLSKLIRTRVDQFHLSQTVSIQDLHLINNSIN